MIKHVKQILLQGFILIVGTVVLAQEGASTETQNISSNTASELASEDSTEIIQYEQFLRVIENTLEEYYKDYASTDAQTDSIIKALGDRKSTRLNSSHVRISYAVFCLKKKRKI